MALNPSDLAFLRAFHTAVVAMSQASIWSGDELKAGFFMTAGGGLHVHEKHLPDMQRFRSLMLDFRQLISNDDDANVNRLCNAVAKSEEWTEQERKAVVNARQRFNKALDQPATMYRQSNGVRPTARQLLEDWISGDWFHRDAARHERRSQREIVENENLSLVVIVPAVREAIQAAIDLDHVIATRL